MKKITSLLVLLLFLSFLSKAQNFYGVAVNSIKGNTIDLHSNKGKKILFIILPANINDTARISEIMVFAKKYKDSINVIGIPSYEDGFAKKEESLLQNLFKNDQGFHVTVTEGMKVKKSSGVYQSVLAQWLTDKNRNKHFNQDVKGAGHKFFIDEIGTLYAVIVPEIFLSSSVIDKIMNRPLAIDTK